MKEQKHHITQYGIPRYIDDSPKVFGYSLIIAVSVIGLFLLALIMIIKSVWLSMLIFVIIGAILKKAPQLEDGSLIDKLTNLMHQDKFVLIDQKIAELLNTKDNGTGSEV